MLSTLVAEFGRIGITLDPATGNITLPTGGKFITDGIGNSQKSKASAQLDATTNTTLANIPGLTANVVAAGVYSFEAYLPGTSTANGGMKVGPGGTATWTGIDTSIEYKTAAAVAVAHGTTATPGTAVGGNTVADILVTVRGTVTINAAGTFTMMFAQNASHSDTSSIYAGATMSISRIS